MLEDIDSGLDYLDEAVALIDYSVIGPSDGRRRVRNTSRFPYGTITHLEKDYGDGRWLGNCSGALVAPRLVLTAAHCLYSRRRRRRGQRPYPARVRVSPGRASRYGLPQGSVIASAFYVPRSYTKAANPRPYDYAVIVLPSPFTRMQRLMRLVPLSDGALNGLKRSGDLVIAGYPGDKARGEMWEHAERLRGFTNRRLKYTVDTCPGQSGSAIWVAKAGLRPAIVGIHTSGVIGASGESYRCKPGETFAPPGSQNSGVRITKTIVRDVTSPATSARMRRLP